MQKKIGDLLVEKGILSPEQLFTALESPREPSNRLASICLSQGLATEETLAKILSLQLGVPFVILSKSTIPIDVIQLITEETARTLQVLPFCRRDNELLIAMADPNKTESIDEIRFGTGLNVVAHGALFGPLQKAIGIAYQCLRVDVDPPEGNFLLRGETLAPVTVLEHKLYDQIVFDQSIALPDFLPPLEELLDESKLGIEIQNSTTLDRPSNESDQKFTVLVVDDNDDLRAMFRKFLLEYGYWPWEAADGTQAMRILQSNLPDVVLLDAMLPGVHGFDICRRLKAAEATRHIPVIMISAIYRSEEHADRVKRLFGANAYLNKPVRLADVDQMIKDCLGARKARPSYSELYSKLQTLLRNAQDAKLQNDPAAVSKYLIAALSVAPFYPSIYQQLALISLRNGVVFQAVAHLEQAVELNPSFSHLIQLAILYQRAGFIGKAQGMYRRSLLACRDERLAEQILNHINKLQR